MPTSIPITRQAAWGNDREPLASAVIAMATPALEDKLRISVGTAEQNVRLVNALARILGKLT